MSVVIDNDLRTVIDESGAEFALPVHGADYDRKLADLYQWQSNYEAELNQEFDRTYRSLLFKAQYNARKQFSTNETPDERYRNGTRQAPYNAAYLGRDESARVLHLMQLGYAVGDIPG